MQSNVTIIIGPGTEVIAGEGKIVTAGGIDTHVHFICPRAQALPAERIVGVETGGCPHTAIREDASMNLAAIEKMN